jgi:hypothetical protein
VTQHRYPTGALASDYARAIIGLALAAAPLLLVPLNPYVAALLALLAALFVIFGGRTLSRQLSPLVMTETGIASTGLVAVEIPWTGLDDVRLAYFATRRDGDGGWMQLALRAGRRRLRLDSRIEGFAVIVERAVRAAVSRHLSLSATTRANLAALGLTVAAGEP